MIASLRGILLSKSPEGVIVDVNGVGYYVQVPLPCFYSLPEPGSEISLYTFTHVREDALQLFGFQREDEKRIFTTLLGITGIGPKLALNILSGMKIEDFIKAVNMENISALASIPGLGKKTAQRLILELREKLPKVGVMGKSGLYNDAVSALVNLGYRKTFAEDAVNRSMRDAESSIEGLVKEALKYLSKVKDDERYSG